MNFIPIKTECHAGYKADEYPTCFYLNRQKFEIREIIDRWYQGDVNPEYPAANYFKVSSVTGQQYILRHETGSGAWFLVVPDANAFFNDRWDQ